MLLCMACSNSDEPAKTVSVNNNLDMCLYVCVCKELLCQLLWGATGEPFKVALVN